MDRMEVIRILKALADGNRLQIFEEISRSGELSCGQVGELFPIAQSTVSHHLKILIDSGLLNLRREGQRGFMTVNNEIYTQFEDALQRVSAGRQTTE